MEMFELIYICDVSCDLVGKKSKGKSNSTKVYQLHNKYVTVIRCSLFVWYTEKTNLRH